MKSLFHAADIIYKLRLIFDICKGRPDFMEGKKRAIKNWAPDDRPREKLKKNGARTLSNSELVAILIREGTVGQSAVEVAKSILNQFQNSLQELGSCSIKDLMRLKIKGLGEAKATFILAALELGKRLQVDVSLDRPVIKDSREAEIYLRPKLAHLQHEEFGVLYLAQSGRIKLYDIASKGGITSTTVDPRLIFQKALEVGAVSIIVGHNHPSGNTRPSKADEALTQKILQGSKYMDIKLLDHIILGRDGYFSFADEGLLA
jgi:DNA repair protein RadC